MSKCKCKGVAYITPTLPDECVLRSGKKTKKMWKNIFFIRKYFINLLIIKYNLKITVNYGNY